MNKEKYELIMQITKKADEMGLLWV